MEKVIFYSIILANMTYLQSLSVTLTVLTETPRGPPDPDEAVSTDCPSVFALHMTFMSSESGAGLVTIVGVTPPAGGSLEF